MRTLITITLFTLLVLEIYPADGWAQDQPAGKVSGYAFGDYYYIVQNKNIARQDLQGFQFRRLYLYYDQKISDNFAAQFLLEGNDAETTLSGKHGVFIKTAYLEWKEVIPKGSLAIGLVPTPTWSSSFSEKVWNYRSIEKTIIDFRKHGAASDIGLTVRGKVDQEGKFGYVAMVGNGSTQKPETNKYKKFYLSLYTKPVKELILEGYADFEGGPNNKTNQVLKGFVAYQHRKFTAGIEAYQRRNRKAGIGGIDVTPFGVSTFAWGRITDKLNLFGRFDYFDPDTKVTEAGEKEGFFVSGLDYMPVKDVHLMPNLWVNTYLPKQPGAPKPDPDIIPRITFFYLYR